jgi:predicted amidohydrolase YtcJ
MLHTGMLGEAYLDGSLGSRSAAMLAPYADDPKNTGIVRTDAGMLTDATIRIRAISRIDSFLTR